MIPLFVTHVPTAVDAPLLEVLHSGQLTQGPQVAEFEKLLGIFLGNPNVLTVNSATSALTLALRLLNVGPGDEVVSTPMTCAATNTPIANSGARIVWADIDPVTGLMDMADLDRKLTPRTKAVVVVDWGGQPCPFPPGPVIEDAAHAFGAGGQRAPFVAYSFQAIKHLTTVDGGALVTPEGAFYKRGKLLRWYGIDRETPREDFRVELDFAEAGYKFHMNDVAATIGIVQMKTIKIVLDAHRRNAEFYDRKLSRYFTRPPYDRRSSYWLYTVLLPGETSRLRFMRYMQAAGIQVSQVHGRNDTKTAFAAFRGEPLPGVEEFSRRMVCIPVHWKLTAEERQSVVDACNAFAHEAE